MNELKIQIFKNVLGGLIGNYLPNAKVRTEPGQVIAPAPVFDAFDLTGGIIDKQLMIQGLMFFYDSVKLKHFHDHIEENIWTLHRQIPGDVFDFNEAGQCSLFMKYAEIYMYEFIVLYNIIRHLPKEKWPNFLKGMADEFRKNNLTQITVNLKI